MADNNETDTTEDGQRKQVCSEKWNYKPLPRRVQPRARGSWHRDLA